MIVRQLLYPLQFLFEILTPVFPDEPADRHRGPVLARAPLVSKPPADGQFRSVE
jgi:hypothetical protein